MPTNTPEDKQEVSGKIVYGSPEIELVPQKIELNAVLSDHTFPHSDVSVSTAPEPQRNRTIIFLHKTKYEDNVIFIRGGLYEEKYPSKYCLVNMSDTPNMTFVAKVFRYNKLYFGKFVFLILYYKFCKHILKNIQNININNNIPL